MSAGRQLPGLSESEARARLAAYGPNLLPADRARSFLTVAWGIATEPMLLLLLLAALVYITIGSIAEGLMLLAFALFSIGLTVFQDWRGENALKAMRELGAPSASVVRDGVERRIPASEVVPGDLIVIGEGERIAADGRLVRATQLAADESLLTGESVPVNKRAAAAVSQDAPVPGGDNQPFVYSGTLAVRGHGLAEVSRTGSQTQAGRIGASLATIVQAQTPLQQVTGRLVRTFGVISIAVCTALVLYYGVVLGDWLQGLLSGIALGMAMLPEEFPVVLTIFLAIGAWRMAQVSVLARRPAVIETLGAATVLCVDKTGTITENRMRVRVLDSGTERLAVQPGQAVPAAFAGLLEAAYLATRRGSYDPMDAAVLDLVPERIEAALADDWGLAREYGLTPELLAVSQLWRDAGGRFRVATKGAPEAVAELCHLDADERQRLARRVHELAGEGLRVLGIAAGEWTGAVPPADPHAFSFCFLGLAGFEDPVRASVPAAMAEATSAGIAVKMITGDYPETARTIGRAAGIDHQGAVLTGSDLDRLDEAALSRAVHDTGIFARIMPEQKLLLVRALQGRGETVAMTGDGVNDAPALKAADIGIAMGARGTDVAREAAGIVLLDEDFGRIITAVRLGRRIFDNLRKVIIYIAAMHVPIAALAFLPLLFGLPPAVYPLHVVILEMIIDSMCSIAFEATPEEPGIMRRPPRPRRQPVAGFPQVLLGLVQGGLLAAAAVGIYAWALASGVPEDTARTMTIVATVAGNIALVRVNATHDPGLLLSGRAVQPTFWLIAAVAVAVVAAAVLVPQLRVLFQFGLPTLLQLALAIGAGLAAAVAADVLKLVPRVRRILGAPPAPAGAPRA
ncbi:cation-translocating P-type ATPase [Devosia sp.]|uniref:cation-translocating P-type ATPase n=1 Tax=Devosia sp. TaxID=1871048 RepID=UPI002EF5D111